MKGTIKKNNSPSVRYDSVSSRLLSDALLPSRTVRIARSGPPTGDKFSDVVSQLQLIARVTNGIALQIGFVESSIPGNDVIAELLHLGSLKPDFLATVKASDVTAIVDLMKKASAGLTDSADVTKVEDRYVNLNSIIRKKFDYDAFKNRNGKGEFKDNLDSLMGAPLTTLINGIVKNLDALKTALDDVKNMNSEDDGSKKSRDASALDFLKHRLDDTEKAATDYGKMTDVVKGLQDLRKKSSFVQQLIAADKAVSYQKTALLVPTTEGQVSANMDAMKQLGSELEKHLEMLNNVYSFIETFQASRQSVFKYSAGFPNGVRDLENLPTDTDNKVFQKSSGLDQKKSQELKLGLLPLDGFKTSLKNVENAWQPAKQKADTAKDVVFEQMAIANLAKNADVRSNTMNKFTTCYETHAPDATTSLTSIAPILQSIHHLNANVTELSTIKFVAPEFDLAALKEATDFKDIQTIQLREAATPDMVKKLKKMPEVAETIAKLETFLKAARSVETMIDNVNKTVNTISNGFSSIEEYHDKMAKSNLGDWIKCLQDIGEDGETVVRMIESIRYLRKFAKMPSTTDAQEFLNTIQQSASLLKSSNDVIYAMKNGAGAEAKAFSHLQNANNVSSSLGMAVQGLTQIKKFQDSRTQLTALTGEVPLVETFADMMQGELTQEVYNTLKEMGSLPKLLNETFDAIVAMAPFADKLDVTDMKSYKPLFEVAAKIKGFAVDSKQMKAALETLARKDATFDQQLANVRALLDALDPLDLDFSRYNVAAGALSLDALDSFFISWSKTVAIVKSENGVSKTKFKNWIIYVIVASVAAFAVIFVISVHLIRRKIKKEERGRNAEFEDPANVLKYERNKKICRIIAKFRKLGEQIDDSIAKLNMCPGQFFNSQVVGLDEISKGQEGLERNKKNLNKRRYPGTLAIEETAVKLKPLVEGQDDPYINANVLHLKHDWLLAQVGCLDLAHQDEKHVSLTTMNEKLQGPLDGSEEAKVPKAKCSKYYPEVGEEAKHFDPYTVKTVKSVDVSAHFTAEQDKISVVAVDYTRGSHTKQTHILRYYGWPDHGVPGNCTVLTEIIDYVDSFKGRAIIHCSAGVARTGVLAGIKKGMEMFEEDDTTNFVKILIKLRESRYKAIQNETQLSIMPPVILMYALQKYNHEEYVKELDELAFYFNETKKNATNPPPYKQLTPEQSTEIINRRDAYLQLKKKEWDDAKAAGVLPPKRYHVEVEKAADKKE